MNTIKLIAVFPDFFPFAFFSSSIDWPIDVYWKKRNNNDISLHTINLLYIITMNIVLIKY